MQAVLFRVFSDSLQSLVDLFPGPAVQHFAPNHLADLLFSFLLDLRTEDEHVSKDDDEDKNDSLDDDCEDKDGEQRMFHTLLSLAMALEPKFVHSAPLPPPPT